MQPGPGASDHVHRSVTIQSFPRLPHADQNFSFARLPWATPVRCGIIVHQNKVARLPRQLKLKLASNVERAVEILARNGRAVVVPCREI